MAEGAKFQEWDPLGFAERTNFPCVAFRNGKTLARGEKCKKVEDD